MFTGDCVFVGGIGALFDGDEERWWRGAEQVRTLYRLRVPHNHLLRIPAVHSLLTVGGAFIDCCNVLSSATSAACPD